MRIRPLLSASAAALGILVGPTAVAQTFLTELVPANTIALEEFGYSVALSGDRILIGSMKSDGDAAVTDSGAAYLFRISGTTWIEEAKLLPGDPVEFGRFGWSVALQEGVAVIGAPGAHQLGQPNGAVYVFEFDGSSWSFADQLQPSDGLADGLSGDRFGSAVDLFEEILVVGSLADHTPAETGSAYVFRHDSVRWQEEAKLVGSSSLEGDCFGSAVAIHGPTVAVGAPGADDGVDDSGAVHLFEENGGTWPESTKLKADTFERDQEVGCSIDLWGDTLVVGAPGDQTGGPGSGAAIVFRRISGGWTQSDRLLPTRSAPEDHFGCSVSVWNDKLVVGAFGCDDAAPGAGGAWLFGRAGATWVELASLLAPGSAPEMRTGFSAAIGESRVALGAPHDSEYQLRIGSLQVWSTDSSPKHAAFCFGVGCPCGNDDPSAGCANSSGHGALLSARGSLSLSVDDLVLAGTNLAPDRFGIVVMASAQTSLIFGDGLRCIDAGGSGYRFFGPPRKTGPGGALEVGPGALHTIPALVAGSTRYFQAWYREQQSPCASGFNVSNGLAITFTP